MVPDTFFCPGCVLGVAVAAAKTEEASTMEMSKAQTLSIRPYARRLVTLWRYFL